MKLLNKTNLIISRLIFLMAGILSLTGCDAVYDQEVFKKNYLQSPSPVLNLNQSIDYEKETIELSWDLPADDIKGILLSAWTDESCRTMCTTAGSLSQQKTIPTATSYTIKELKLSRKYCFSVQTIGSNDIVSDIKKTIVYSPTEHNSLITYNLTEKAYDFGYRASEKEVEIVWLNTTTSNLDIAPTVKNKTQNSRGDFVFVSANKTSIAPGEKVSIIVKYIPSLYDQTDATASFDIADLEISQSINPAPYIKLLGTNFPQPSNIGSDENGDHLRLWLRPELISQEDIVHDSTSNVDLVSKLPDYSGNNFNAYADTGVNTDSRPLYEKNIFNGNPALLYTTKDKRLTASGNIASNRYSGTTSFIVLKRAEEKRTSVIKDTSYLYAFYLSASNGADYTFPMVESRYFSYSPDNSSGYGASKIDNVINPNYRKPTFTICDTSFFDGSQRYLFDEEKNIDDDDTAKHPHPITVDRNKPYAVCSVYDKDKVTHNRKSNLYAYLNGKKKLVSYSNNRESSPDPDKNQWYTYGLPWSDGDGNLNKIFRKQGEGEKLLSYDSTTYSSENKSDFYYEYMLYPDTFETDKGYKHPMAIQWWYNKANGISSTDYSQYYANSIKTNTDNYDKRANIIRYVYLGSRPSYNIYTSNTSYDPYVYIADVIIYDKALSEEEISMVHKYIKYKYGIGE